MDCSSTIFLILTLTDHHNGTVTVLLQQLQDCSLCVYSISRLVTHLRLCTLVVYANDLFAVLLRYFDLATP